MSLFLVTYYADIALFAIISFLAMGALHLWVRRSGQGLRPMIWTALLSVITIGSTLSIDAGRRESARLRDTVSGFAPTYADELSRLGLEQITLDIPPTDPTYLALIETEKRWLKNNPEVADIYTFVRRPSDGKIVLLVDSETDYDHNGIFEGEREQRTPIGEVYEDDTDKIERALAGERVFLSTPTTDRWGTWISSFVPIFSPDGARVIGVLGIDYPAEEWVSSILYHRAAMLASAGMVIAVLVFSVGTNSVMKAEINRRRQTEAALRASELRLRTIVDNEPECVMVIDRKGNVVEINPAGMRLLEGTSEELIGKPVFPLVHEAHRELFRKYHSDICNGRSGMLEVEFIGTQGNAQTVWMETHSVPLRNDDSNVVSILSVARDVTVRKQAEAEKEMLQRQLLDASRRAGMAEIATGVLHNVGNVLNSVNVSANVIQEHLQAADVNGLSKATEMIAAHRADLPSFLTGDEIGRQLPDFLSLMAQCLTDEHRAVEQELRRLTDGIEHIKEIVRTQQTHAKGSNLALPMRPVEIVEEAVRVNFAGAERHGIEFIKELQEIGLVSIDKHKVLQILVNLMSNAKHAVQEMPEGSRRITTRMRSAQDGQRLVFEVQDTGMGIAPDVMRRLFQHGFTTKADGHGFGLHSAANAAVEMGGSLVANSDGPHRGATFVLNIPLLPATAPIGGAA